MRRTHQQPTEENIMRKFIISATVAAIAAISFAAPSYAGHHGHHRHHHGHYHGGFSIGFYDGGYYGGYYEPSCYIKKVKRWDRWGNLRIKRIRICD
jgi:hypothetical protein